MRWGSTWVIAELFFSQGYAETTIAQVADRSDVAAGTVMLHFGSKSELATAAFADEIAKVVQQAVDSTNSQAKGAVEARLGAFVRQIFEWYETHADVAPGLLREALFSEGKWADHYAQTVNKTVVAFATIAATHVDADAALLGEGLLADYFIVLLRLSAVLRVGDQAENLEHHGHGPVTGDLIR